MQAIATGTGRGMAPLSSPIMGKPAGLGVLGRFARANGFVAFALWLAAAGSATAQHGFVAPEDRHLHERLAAARVVAIATVAAVETGRLRVEDAAAIVDTVAPEFQLKRAPSHPPPWAPGDRVLLLIAGARSPYRWTDRPVEAITVADAAAERRLARAVRAMEAVGDDPGPRRDLYARWSDGTDEDLAALGQRGLMDRPGMASVLDADFARERASVAADAGRPIEVRRRAARIAARHPAGIAALLRTLGRTLPVTDVRIAEITLEAGLLARDPAAETRLVDVLGEPGTELGWLGLRLAMFARGTDVERKLSEVAVGHPDAAVRSEAIHALKRLRHNRSVGGG